ncbi:DUF2273 domain-containing protein [Paenibacillus lactis]|uniref:Membrane protein n=1 Tax=Paenibacillus lactis TaxID=228574 RepID=A0ABS4F9Y7_9BACL|nr:DUF2273 domain-containing protein [Paenibacillus lactis]MBP1893074.1 putative membrane protein [Paenibacillus lactis]HAF97465.1 hypothetical protein [Paenibacillus lactis]
MPWKEIWESHRGRIFGVAGGLVCGLIYLLSGFWDMLFFALVVFIGYTFGKRKDLNQGSIFHFQEWGRWLSERCRPFK